MKFEEYTDNSNKKLFGGFKQYSQLVETRLFKVQTKELHRRNNNINPQEER